MTQFDFKMHQAIARRFEKDALVMMKRNSQENPQVTHNAPVPPASRKGAYKGAS
jgi:hypothetical protein